ncbi:GNAT domain-containing protein [Aspergillus crustosus]
MLLNATTAISTSKVLLVPYSKWHVPRYHEWMQDEEIQEATASEPLTLEEEYAMQQSWRNDADKLTFIICLPLTEDNHESSDLEPLTPESDSPTRLIGDMNLFLRIDDGDDGTSSPEIIGEIELMIAEKKDQKRGFGKAALLTFLRYVVGHEAEIVEEFLLGEKDREANVTERKFAALSVKIGEKNERSLKLFESVGFERVGESPSYFGEWELRRVRDGLGMENAERELEGTGVKGYREAVYQREE